MNYTIKIKSFEHPFVFYHCDIIDSSVSEKSVRLECEELEKQYFFIEAQNKELNSHVNELATDLDESVELIKKIISAKNQNEKYIAEGDAIQFAERIAGKEWKDI